VAQIPDAKVRIEGLHPNPIAAVLIKALDGVVWLTFSAMVIGGCLKCTGAL
jgi:hypothetical protein